MNAFFWTFFTSNGYQLENEKNQAIDKVAQQTNKHSNTSQCNCSSLLSSK